MEWWNSWPRLAGHSGRLGLVPAGGAWNATPPEKSRERGVGLTGGRGNLRPRHYCHYAFSHRQAHVLIYAHTHIGSTFY